ncbi:hypothetical protein AVEN_263687-1 [Araneus ventricosus]|uniref:Histone-lysine N-methyltransferase SETMAR n=1 Tax=Araneus ventricosus TaxID=182803 RepID=A0A4Y2AUI4_ARAVE|nr:hypothetical protein AVEN_263687-1 [Araneus ventricosus]
MPLSLDKFIIDCCLCGGFVAYNGAENQFEILVQIGYKSAGESHAMLKQVYGDGLCSRCLKSVVTGVKASKISIGTGRPHRKKPDSWFLLHDNARLHTATLVKQFLAQHGVNELLRPPYYPDLSPPDFFLFLKLKMSLKGRRFRDITHIQTAVTRELKAIPMEEFSRAFEDLYTRCQRCIVYNGDYFEGL